MLHFKKWTFFNGLQGPTQSDSCILPWQSSTSSKYSTATLVLLGLILFLSYMPFLVSGPSCLLSPSFGMLLPRFWDGWLLFTVQVSNQTSPFGRGFPWPPSLEWLPIQVTPLPFFCIVLTVVWRYFTDLIIDISSPHSVVPGTAVLASTWGLMHYLGSTLYLLGTTGHSGSGTQRCAV